jgi:hypothetical protein
VVGVYVLCFDSGERKDRKYAKHCFSRYPYMPMFLLSNCTQHTTVKSPCQSRSCMRITNIIFPPTPPPARNIKLVRSLRRVYSTSCPHNGLLTKFPSVQSAGTSVYWFKYSTTYLRRHSEIQNVKAVTQCRLNNAFELHGWNLSRHSNWPCSKGLIPVPLRSCPSLRTNQRGFDWTEFHEIWHWGLFSENLSRN